MPDNIALSSADCLPSLAPAPMSGHLATPIHGNNNQMSSSDFHSYVANPNPVAAQLQMIPSDWQKYNENFHSHNIILVLVAQSQTTIL